MGININLFVSGLLSITVYGNFVTGELVVRGIWNPSHGILITCDGFYLILLGCLRMLSCRV